MFQTARAQFLVIASLVTLASTVHARGGGIAGRADAAADGAGCGPCHGAASSTTVVTLTGPMQVLPGSTNSYSLTIEGAPAISGGFNASASGGVLAPGAASKLLDGELVHSEPKTAVEGVIQFDFQLVAPQEEGSLVLHAVGNSANGDGQRSDDDNWSFAAPLEIQVTAAPGQVTPEAGPVSGAPANGAPTPKTVPVTDAVSSGAPEEGAGCSATGGSLMLLVLVTQGLWIGRRRMYRR